jgi:hypothetical protein
VGRAEPDIVTYTGPSRSIPVADRGGNGGSPVTVAARISFNGGGNGRFQIRNAVGTRPSRSERFWGRTRASVNFMNSTITMLGNTTTSCWDARRSTTVLTTRARQWRSSAGAYDAAANACAVITVNAGGSPKVWF